jgi:sugar phosphate isomerase/epimerase
MRNVISFMGANYVAREVRWKMPEGWMQGQNAVHAWFSPAETFAERFDALLQAVKALGFDALDIWDAQLHGSWATERHLEAARALLGKRGLVVPALAGNFGATPEELRSACRVARAVGASILSGGTPLLSEGRPGLVSLLRGQGLRLAVENHAEKTPEELLGRLGKGDEDVVGAAVDTGWFGTQGCDAARALEQLAPRLFHVHLKDVKARRAEKTGFQLIDMGHETCRLGAGIVPIAGCVTALGRCGYAGPIAIEHEPEDFDPSDDCRASLLYLRQLMERLP